jgi:hypothetical protein
MEQTRGKSSRMLGIAFLLQSAVIPLFSGFVLKPALFVIGGAAAVMTNVADKTLMMQGYVLLEVMQALAVAFLGAVLFGTLRKQNEKLAAAGLAFYILEAAVMISCRVGEFSLLRMSQEWLAAGRPDYLLAMGTATLSWIDFAFGGPLMLAFELGAVPFYYLLFRSRVIPRWLSLWGLITVICPCLIATVLFFFGLDLPMFVYFIYGPFEIVAGIWIVIKGIPGEAAHG